MIDGFNRALARIEERLDQDVDVEELARLALTSTYHFRRLFSALAGMPLSTYVRRRRMTLAAAEVQAGDASLLAIAARYGYGSTEAFGRAFRAVHGVSPGALRVGDVPVVLVTQPRLTFRLTVEGDTSMRHRIVDKGPFTIAGKKARVPLIYEGVNPHMAAFLEGLPDEIHGRIKALSDQDPAGILAVTHVLDEGREEGSDVDYYHATVTSGEVPDDLDVLEVPAWTWAVFEVSGPFPEALQSLWADTAAVWFPSNPYRAIHGPELLKVAYSEDHTHADCELWIPVEHEPRA